jgi:hypothetical protein
VIGETKPAGFVILPAAWATTGGTGTLTRARLQVTLAFRHAGTVTIDAPVTAPGGP